MPISTLWAKSMPSTNSRKPCTKCWRDCSPSPTMSMPASSCNLIASSVASSLPASRSAPCRRHCGHNLSGSASQDGFGRLPAMVEGNSMVLARALEAFWRLPTIEPVVARAQLFSAQQAHAEIADEGFRSAAAIDAGLAARGLLGTRSAHTPCALIGAQRIGRIVQIFAEHIGKYRGVLDCHAGALRQERQHGVGGIPNQGDRPDAAAKRAAAIV